MRKIKRFILSFIFLMVIWIFLTSAIRGDDLIIGLLVSFIGSLLFYRFSDIYADVKITPKSLFKLVIYIFVFIKELIKANIDVALRVINPALPINPGIVSVKTKLKSRLAKLILANSITLTPGTLTLDVKDDELFIHWIDVKSMDVEEATKKISMRFEKILKGIIE